MQDSNVMFSTFIETLREDGELFEITTPASPKYELTQLSNKHKGAMLFHNVNGWKVAVNILGTRELLAKALDIPKEEIVHTLSTIEPDGTVRIIDKPREEMIEETDMSKLPILTHYENDGGAYITSGIVISEYDGVENASIHRLMVIDGKKVAARLVEGRHTDNLYQRAKKDNKQLPVAVAIGVDPVILYAACTRVPEGREFHYASAIKGEAVELFRCENGIKVPPCEILLEGYIDKELHNEGGFVDITGTYDNTRLQPVIHITKILHRKNPIYHAILPSSGEHKILMGIPYEPLIYKEAQKYARVKNVILSDGGCCYLHALIQISKRHEHEPEAVIQAAFKAHRSLKHVVVVDDDIDIFSPLDVEYAIATRVQADKDLHIYPNQRGSSLDPSRKTDGTTTKIGIDATCELARKNEYQRITA
ncbi:MAG: 3-octaprenyl-4-hydroxybenzoate carboxy-lyase [Candidatus Argoarchaeum ethanivorans]|uniref:Anhydromevalonate phosphate decarboxylase n=1 Tax=Candidatus Argoarchaeum ethanivorans TaxID=2608793 RepID=A0A811TAT6_9EURY|nr:MAG: 3-octaprenyl-4-hydroxybenzoate carboxy-lyase [Candidatus Argoarchaeum ethanivorans]